MRVEFPEMNIAIIEQDDNLPWNKGLLFNAGFKELSEEYDYIILHDIDFIPEQGKVDYSYCEIPTMIAAEASQFDYKLCYPQFFGGVVVVSKEHYNLVNGFSNQFKGYGGEDDLFYRSFQDKNIPLATKTGRFECFAHPRPKREEHYRHNLTILGSGRNYSEGLSTVEYEITSLDYKSDYIHLKIKSNG